MALSADGLPVPLDARPDDCPYWEPPLDCQDCGACCREAYDTVPITEEEAERLPDLAQLHGDGWRDLRRAPSPRGEGTWCAALTAPGGRYTCTHYAIRPATCREVETGSEGCLVARRRVGLSPWPPGLHAHSAFQG